MVFVDGLTHERQTKERSVIMADTAAESEADSGSGGQLQQVPDGPTTPDDESDRVTASNTNYDSGEGNHRLESIADKICVNDFLFS